MDFILELWKFYTALELRSGYTKMVRRSRNSVCGYVSEITYTISLRAQITNPYESSNLSRNMVGQELTRFQVLNEHGAIQQVKRDHQYDRDSR